MLNISDINVGDIIKCGDSKAIVTFIDGVEIEIIHAWGEVDVLRNEHFKQWSKTGEVSKMLDCMLKEIKKNF